MKLVKIFYTLVVLLPILPASLYAENRQLPAQELPVHKQSVQTPLQQDKKLISGSLANGMKYLIYPHHQPKNQVILWLQVHAGSLEEQQDQLGVAHFTEHMLFNGTTHYPGNQVIDKLTSLGLKFGKDINAYTSYAETVYQVTIPLTASSTTASSTTASSTTPSITPLTNEAKLFAVMDIFKEWISEASFTPQQTEAERGVIIEEWRASQGIKWRNAQARRPFLLANSRYLLREPIGSMDIVATVSPQRLRDYYRRWYRTNNMTFIMVGDISEDQALSLMNNTLAKIPAAEKQQKPLLQTQPENTSRFNVIKDNENIVNSISLYYRMPLIKVTTEQTFLQHDELALLLQLFNQRMQQRMNDGELANISGSMARSLQITNDYQAVLFQVNAKNQALKQAAQVLTDELARIDRYGFSQAELDEVKITRLNWLKNAANQQNERSNQILAARLAYSSLNQIPVISPQQRYQLAQKLWQKITPQHLAKRWKILRSGQDKFWEQVINPNAEKQVLTARQINLLETQSAAHVINHTNPPYVFPQKPLTLQQDNADKTVVNKTIVNKTITNKGRIITTQTLAPGIIKFTLSNGAQLILLKPDSGDNPDNPDNQNSKISLLALINKGMLSYPAAEKSIIALANKVVTESGVGALSAHELKRWSAEHAITISSRVNNLHTLISVNSTVANLASAFQLMQQRITASRINEHLWNRFKNTFRQSLETLDQRPADFFAQQLAQIRYADSRTQLITDKQINAVSAHEALIMDRQLFADPQAITFILAGNIQQQQVIPLINQYFAGIQAADHEILAVNTPLIRAQQDNRLLSYKATEPVAKVISWKRFDTTLPVSPQVDLAIQALNYSLANELRLKLREQLSGLYSVTTQFIIDPLVRDISWKLSFSCQPERYSELLTVANEIVARRLNNGISQQELTEYRINKMNTFRLQQQNTQKLAKLVANSLQQHNTPLAWLEQEKYLQTMTVQDINLVLADYFAAQPVTITGILLPQKTSAAVKIEQGDEADTDKADTDKADHK